MSKYFFASVSFHITLVIIFALWPALFKPHAVEDNTIVISVVDIGEITNVKISPKNKAAAVTESKPKTNPIPPAPAPAPPTPPPAPPKAEPAIPEPAAPEEPKLSEKPAETIAPPKPKPEPAKKPEPAPKKTPKPVKPTPKPAAKPQPINKEFSESILKTLEKSQMAKKEKQKKADEVAKMTEELLGKSDRPFNESQPMSIAEIDLLKSQIAQHWNTTAFSGANSEGMEVTLTVIVDIDGNVLDVRATNRQAGKNAAYSVFVESAIRAAKKASPLQNLPRDKFPSWQEIELHFDSSGMIY